MPSAWRLAWMGLVTLVLAAVPAQAVHLRGQVVRVGFTGTSRRSGGTGADHFRVGSYTPVWVELANADADSFRCTIEARQADRDGDEIVARREVMVTGTQRYYLYVPGGENQGRDQFRVRVLNMDENLVPLFDDQDKPTPELRPAADPFPIESDDRVILDITEVNRLRELVSNTQLNRAVTVLRVAARDLPDDAAGLEMADTIVWDGGDLEAFRDLPQRQALLEWTRRGGRLVIGVSRNWEQLGRSKFGEILPARLSGTATMKEVDRKWCDDLVGGPAADLDPPLTYCRVPFRALLPGALPLIPQGIDEPLKPEDLMLAVRRPFGRGDVVLVTTEIRELLDPKRSSSIEPTLLLPRLVGLRNETAKEDENLRGLREDLFKYAEQQTGFQVTTQLYLLFAFVFVVGYVLLATGGSWVWLKKRKLTQHAWASFALVAVVASGVSLAAVSLIRGVGYRVQELAVVDAQAGSTDAAAVIYWGLKTPTHTTLDVRMATRGRSVDETPDGTTSLRPLPANTDPMAMSGGQFRAGQRYEAVAALGELRGVPLRATLKQFEGLWHGTMTGRLDASVRRIRGLVGVDGWIRNDLGTDLKKCYLLVPIESAGWPKRSKSEMGIRSYYLGDLPKGTKVSIGEIQAAQAKEAGVPVDAPSRVVYLSETQKNWLISRFGAKAEPTYRTTGEEEKVDLGKLNEALILMSTFDEMDVTQRRQVVRSQGQHLDRSLAMSRQSALLIGFSEDPGPATLCWRRAGGTKEKWRALPSEDDRKVMYRITIPIEP